MNKFFQSALFAFTTVTVSVFTTTAVAGEKVDQSLAQNDATHVKVENRLGKVTISGWDKDKITVVGELADKAKGLIFEQRGNYINVIVDMPRHSNNGWNDKGTVLDIKVPAQIKVSFNGVSSNVVVSNIKQSADIRTVSGNIKANDLAQRIELNTVSGDINSDDLSGKIAMSTVSGDIDDRNSQGSLKLKAVSGNLSSESSANEVSANSVSGEIELKLMEVDDLKVSTVSGDVDGRLALNDDGRLKMSSVSGDIDMHFTNKVQADFRLKSNASGDLINRLTSDKALKAKYGPSSKLYFETGDASASVKGSTVSGRIKISG